MSKLLYSVRACIALAFFLMLFNAFKLNAQVQLSGDLQDHIEQIIGGFPAEGGNEYANPEKWEMIHWAEMLDSLLQGNYAVCHQLADTIGYQLIQFTDGGKIHYILQKQDTASNYWGTYVLDTAACRDLVIQCPHPKKDLNTGKEGIHIFRRSSAFFYCLTGTNRCNHDSLSACSGVSTICTGSSSAYPISDVAHNDSTIFQRTTMILAKRKESLIFMQLHGFSKKTTDPYVIMSNGTTKEPINDPIPAFRDALLVFDDSLSFRIPHIDSAWTRLMGSTNTQGRQLNGSLAPCGSAADTSFGRFIHLEQEKTRLRQDSSKWEIVAQAVSMAFPCHIDTIPDSTSDTTSLVEPRRINRLSIYPNPLQDRLNWKWAAPNYTNVHVVFYDLLGREVYVFNTEGKRSGSRSSPELAAGLYQLQLRDIDSKVMWTETISLK